MKSPSRILILIYLKDHKGHHSSKIQRNLKITQACVSRALKLLFSNKIIYKVRGEGRMEYLFLTEKGEEIAKKFYQLDRLLSFSS